MEAIQKIITVTLSPCLDWSDRAAQWLARAADNTLDMEDLKRHFEQGAALFEVMHEGECVGAFLLQVQAMVRGNEGVILAAGARLAGVNLLNTILPEIEKLFIGCVTVRVHSARPGMASRLKMQGYEPLEVVYRKAL